MCRLKEKVFLFMDTNNYSYKISYNHDVKINIFRTLYYFNDAKELK